MATGRPVHSDGEEELWVEANWVTKQLEKWAKRTAASPDTLGKYMLCFTRLCVEVQINNV